MQPEEINIAGCKCRFSLYHILKDNARNPCPNLPITGNSSGGIFALTATKKKNRP